MIGLSRTTGVLLSALVVAAAARAQGTAADYARADGLRERTRGMVAQERLDVRWLDGGRRLLYRVEEVSGAWRWVLVDCEGGTTAPAFDHRRAAKALAVVLGRDVDGTRLPLEEVAVASDRVLLWVKDSGRVFAWRDATGELVDESFADAGSLALEPLPAGARPARGGGGPALIAFVNRTDGTVELVWLQTRGDERSYGRIEPGRTRLQRTSVGHRFEVRDAAGAALQRFDALRGVHVAIIDGAPGPGPTERPARSSDVSPDGRYAVRFHDHDVHLRALETGEEARLTDGGTEADAFAGPVWWAPDSSRFVVMKTKAAEERTIHFVESSPRDQLQPRLHTRRYRKPGDALPQPRPWRFDVATRSGRAVDDALFGNPWSLTELRWSPDGRRFTFLYNQRGHQVLRVIAVDAATGAPQAIVDEVSATFIDYAGKSFLRVLDGTDELVWMSERDGWNHLYLVDASSGAVKNAITTGAWVVRAVDRIDTERRLIWFRAGGLVPGEDPYQLHYARVSLDGGEVVRLTDGDGSHEIEPSPDGRFFVDTWSRVDLPPRRALRRMVDGGLVSALPGADWTPLLASGWRVPERFVAPARDDRTDIHGVIFRPSNHDPSRTYPVVEQIYAGPHGAHVPKTFERARGAQVMAELGFIVVQIDGMGTSHRSKAFHDVCSRNLGDAGLPDRVGWIRAAQARDPSMDLDRVGIYGGSAGGQSALRALLVHGDFYRVAVADCGCHDNRMDKIWWNELWMGWPIGPHYEEQSNVTQAHRLEGKLLLIVGELDRNVDPASTMQVVDALVRADRDFDMLVIPGAGHGAAGTPYGRRRQRDFLVRHLLGVEPPRPARK